MTRILVVDDDPTVLRLMVQILSTLPAITMGAGDVATATALPGPFDLLVLDRRLPNGDGREIAAHFAGTPTIYVSGYQDEVDLCKPFTAPQLQDVVRRALHAERR